MTIIKFEDNKDFEREMAEFKEKGAHKFAPGYYDSSKFPEEPQKELAERSLEVYLTEEEYKAVKEGVLKTFS